MKNILILLAISMFAIACKPKENADLIKTETMKLHDDVMKNHSQIVSYQMKIDTLLKSLSKLKAQFPAIDTLNEKIELNKLLTDLVKAEDGMNNWMHNFNADYTNPSDTAVINYYKKERDKIADVDLIYKKEIKRAAAYLKKFEK